MDTLAPFRAFVSYCHADRAFAAWLQRRLETYRLPRRLAGKVAPLPGQGPGRIGPVFRDRADLSAAEDLSQAVRDAIGRSSALVVVASPDAAASVWVAREIDLFRELHPKAPVLVALARGEPREALPEALRRDDTEPLCADFRKQGDGKRLAFLKIVAGLTHLPLDALVQRDAQRRVRRVTAALSAAGVLLLIMALLLGIALRARQEAERQRLEAERQRSGAEGLVEYMLTDLRERLRGVGRPDVMAAVNERAMAYYAAQGDLSRLPDTSLDRRARILHAMGEDDEKLGNMPGALAKFREAHRTTAAILARAPRDPDRVFAHAQSEFWVGYAASRNGRTAETARHWRAYLAGATLLAKLEPGSLRGVSERGYAAGNLCDVEFNGLKDFAAATRDCEASLADIRRAHAKQPADAKLQRDLANRYGWVARVQLKLRQYRLAMANEAAARALMDDLLRRDPQNAEYRMRRSWPDIGDAQALIDLGRPKDAAKLLRPRWAAYRQLMLSQKNSDYWETGARIVLLLWKAETRLKSPLQLEAAREAEAVIAEYVRRFPARKEQIQALKANLNPSA
jgi:cell division septum initiation protein DivIVA